VDEFRALFGDEQTDYGAALTRHYTEEPPAGWADRHVSAYATMHPWEDWAETFAHYLHIRDTLQTAAAFRMRIDMPDNPLSAQPAVQIDHEPFETILADWLPLTYLIAVDLAVTRGQLVLPTRSRPGAARADQNRYTRRARRHAQPP